MFRSTKLWLLAGLVAATSVITATYAAEAVKPGHYKIGKVATAAQIAGWDIDIRPDGQGLPAGKGSVEEGDVLFQEQCAQCHGVFGQGEGRWPVLAGGEDSLGEDQPEKTVGSYWPYATTLWDYIHRAMPFFSPQSLSNDEVYALTAYLLNLNDIVDDDFIASQDNLAAVEMPNRDGFFQDPRPDVQTARCMNNCKSPDDIKITWDATDLGVTPVEHLSNNPATQSANIKVDPAAIDIYERSCAVCHNQGVAGAPVTGDKSLWLERIAKGVDTLTDHAINGYRGKTGFMPAKGGNTTLSDEDVAAAVQFMIEQSQGEDTQL